MIAQFVMGQIDSTMEINKSLMPYYRLSPGFCLGHGLWQLSIQDLTANYLGSASLSPLDTAIAGADAWRLFWLGPVYLLIAIVVDYATSFPVVAVRLAQYTQKRLAEVMDEPHEDDEDVAKERERVSSCADQLGGMGGILIQIQGLRKVYGPVSKHKVAVAGVSFAVEPGECFGYLGVNGAGKTTTMKCLTGVPCQDSSRLPSC